jgi:hypothetical protein
MSDDVTPSEGDANAAKVADLEAKVAEATQKLATSDAQLQQMGTQLENARNYVAGLLKQAQEDAAQGVESNAVDFKERFEEDPEKAVNDLFQARIGPIYNDYLSNQSVSARELAKEKLERRAEGDRWSDYEAEIDVEMNKLSVEARARPDIYEKAFELVRARHVDDIVNRRVEERNTAEKVAQTEAASPPKGRAPEVKTLTPEEKRVAELLGVPEDRYSKSKEEHDAAGGFWQGNVGARR